MWLKVECFVSARCVFGVVVLFVSGKRQKDNVERKRKGGGTFFPTEERRFD